MVTRIANDKQENRPVSCGSRVFNEIDTALGP